MPPRKVKPASGGIAPTVKVSSAPVMGRPIGSTILQPDDATLEQIEGLGRVQLSYREAGAFFGVDHETFRSFLATHKKAEDAFAKGLGDGKARIRRKQIQRALDDGDTTMLIWLGKQYLEQKDKNELTGKDGQPLVQPAIYVTTTPGSAS